jgi:hypothetical protein
MSFDIAIQAVDVSDAAMEKFKRFMEGKGLPYSLDMLADWRTNFLWVVGDEDDLELEVEVSPCNEKFEDIRDPAMYAGARYFEIRLSVQFSSASLAFLIGAGLAYALNSKVHDMQCVGSDPVLQEALKDVPFGSSVVSQGIYDAEFAFQLAKVIEARKGKSSG